MLTVKRIARKDETEFDLSGTLDERDDLDALILNSAVSAHPSKLVFRCKRVIKINSAAVTRWIQFLTNLRAQNYSVIFEEFSHALASQLSMIRNFTAGFPVHSLSLPFLCQKCGEALAGSFAVAALKAQKFQVPSLPCPHCKGKAEFDESPDEYFAFLVPKK